RAHQDRPAAVGTAPVERLPQVLDAGGGLAADQVRQLSDRGVHRICFPLDHRLAPADQPPSRGEFENEPSWRHLAKLERPHPQVALVGGREIRGGGGWTGSHLAWQFDRVTNADNLGIECHCLSHPAPPRTTPIGLLWQDRLCQGEKNSDCWKKIRDIGTAAGSTGSCW